MHISGYENSNSTELHIDFNECLIQNHLHAYQTYEIIAIIFYCGCLAIFLFVAMFACKLSIFYPNQCVKQKSQLAFRELNLIYWFIG